MNLRQEKQDKFFAHHVDTFRKLGIVDPFFVIKTAFFQKGKYGRHVQFFEGELKKGEDIYIEFYDNVFNEKNVIIDFKPFYDERLLFKFRANPHFAEEYEQKTGTNSKTQEEYFTYTIPLAELVVITPDGREISFPAYEKSKEVSQLNEEPLPRLQNSIFPNFEEEFSLLTNNEEIADAPLSEMTIRDLAAIMLMRPVSSKTWLNDIVKQSKSDI